ncbi:enoyl-CoA delta isomerase 1, mitochondrial-like [Nilaparvata lugens]|uniref:enoyl-CoA delta isomerase 1, mitochondrial-like n=1 Tax=Nilaparvata lugens TaxID=108931 RepID=UPI00193CC3B8|nr:enoyl-CoA delta isomerase 1, mitochondrial-like [Nilaparvata lugens]
MMFRICSSLQRSASTAVKEAKRFYSDGAKLVTVTTDDKTGVSTLSLNRPPVNGLNLDLLQSISTALTTLEKSKCRGMILTSDNPSVFSAGLDILEMYKPDPTRVKDFWTTLQDTWIKLYTTSFPTVAVINGHSPAGGCLLALSCEYRIIVGPKNTIGLNETKLGIIAPRWFQDSMRNVIGERQAELALTTGKMFTADEALKVNLVDEVVASKDEATGRAIAFLSQFAKITSTTKKNDKTGVSRGNRQLAPQQQGERFADFPQLHQPAQSPGGTWNVLRISEEEVGQVNNFNLKNIVLS